KALESGATLVVNLRQALMLIDALYQKWITERQGREFWTLQSWQECHLLG
ncbi:DDX10, partial [Symbiodinium necroappetens]